MGIPADAAMSARQLCHCKVTETKSRNLALLGGELYGLYLWGGKKIEIIWFSLNEISLWEEKSKQNKFVQWQRKIGTELKLWGEKQSYNCEIFSEDKMFKIFLPSPLSFSLGLPKIKCKIALVL